MKKYKNIDDLFREELSGMELTPSNNLWSSIQSRLFGPNYSRIIMLVIIIFLGIASIIYLSQSKKTTNNTTITDADNSVLKNENIGTKNEKPNFEYKNTTVTPDNENEQIEITEAIDLKTDKEADIQSGEMQMGTSVYSSAAHNFGDNNRSGFIINPVYSRQNYNLLINQDEEITDRDKTVTIEEYLNKKRDFHAYTSLSGSIGKVFYNDSRDMLTWSFNLGIGYKIKSFYIETGIGHERVDQHGDFRIDYQTNDSVGFYNEVVSFEVNPQNSDEISYNTRETIVYDSVSHYILQSPVYKYNYMNIPLILGYRILNKDRLSVSIQTGIIYSMLTRTEVPEINYYNPEAKLISINNYTPDRVDHNWKLHLALRLNYNIHRGLSLGVEPEFNKYLNSIYVGNSGKKLYPYSAGVKAGLYFNF